MSEPRLHAVSYHYVRDFPRTKHPNIKGMLTADFEAQVDALKGRFEMATLESALAFLAGTYKPSRDLCLLTFDDGVKEHAETVTPLLKKRNITGLFFLITDTVENHGVPETHKNHFLLASLPFADYSAAFLKKLREKAPEFSTEVDTAKATATYRWDTPEVARFKFMLNFRMPEATRRDILTELFRQYLGDEATFSRELFVSWDEARAMQDAGMILGGHSHRHIALSSLSDVDLHADLTTARHLLTQRLRPQPLLPFAYPYGKAHTYDARTVEELKRLGFACGFCTEVGDNGVGADRFSIRRVDPKEVR